MWLPCTTCACIRSGGRLVRLLSRRCESNRDLGSLRACARRWICSCQQLRVVSVPCHSIHVHVCDEVEDPGRLVLQVVPGQKSCNSRAYLSFQLETHLAHKIRHSHRKALQIWHPNHIGEKCWLRVFAPSSTLRHLHDGQGEEKALGAAFRPVVTASGVYDEC